MERSKKQERIQIAIMFGIYLCIILLLVAIIVMVKNIDEIKSDPIIYGIDKKNFAMCSCYSNDGNLYNYNSTSQIFKDKNVGWNIDLTTEAISKLDESFVTSE